MTDEQKNKVLNRLKVLMPDVDNDALLEQLIGDAAEFVCDYTFRAEVPDELLRTVGDLAIVAYNRMGTEGETNRSEGGESYGFENSPEHIYNILNRYRLARTGGVAHAATQTDQS